MSVFFFLDFDGVASRVCKRDNERGIKAEVAFCTEILVLGINRGRVQVQLRRSNCHFDESVASLITVLRRVPV